MVVAQEKTIAPYSSRQDKSENNEGLGSMIGLSSPNEILFNCESLKRRAKVKFNSPSNFVYF